MDYSEAVTFGVLPLDKDLRIGKMATVTLEPGQREAINPATSDSLPSGEADKNQHIDDNEQHSAQSESHTYSNKQAGKNDASKEAPKSHSQDKFEDLKWLPFALWGALIAVGVSILVAGILWLQRYIECRLVK